MKKSFFILAIMGLPAMGNDMPPLIPDGPVTYESVSYDDAMGGYTDPYLFADAPAPTAPPIAAPQSSDKRGELQFNAYSSNYQVRGMGVTDLMAANGYSSLKGKAYMPNRNLFNMGLYHGLKGEVGVVWGATAELADTPIIGLGYMMGKEIAPNLTLELGYDIRHGGFEGFMARYANGAPHRLTQDLNLELAFNDHQRGFFGHVLWGWSFYGLTGHYLDGEIGYRFTDVINRPTWGADLEVSVGTSASFGYWGAGVEGIDATRLQVALPLYTHSGSMGRDGHFHIKPWVMFSTSGSNAGKIDRVIQCGPVDHFQFTIGLDLGWTF
ncbi:MAG: hypothetical protein E7033_04205 [Akkermansiaceae bacterium]|nr:hypothetical protein [Akkermansiaceae bacterium]